MKYKCKVYKFEDVLASTKELTEQPIPPSLTKNEQEVLSILHRFGEREQREFIGAAGYIARDIRRF